MDLSLSSQILNLLPIVCPKSNKSLVAIAERHYKHWLHRFFPPTSPMRSILTCVVISVLLNGCTVEGVIVEKRSRQRPDSSMIGTEGVYSFAFRGPTGTSRPPITVPNPKFWTETGGSYKFMLRDRHGNVCSQLVTPEVFARYNVGDYFNDTLPPVETRDAKDSPTKLAVHRRYSTQRQSQTAQTRRTHRRLAKHHHRLKRQQAIAHRASSKTRQG
jgi:hypothetical protein